MNATPGWLQAIVRFFVSNQLLINRWLVTSEALLLVFWVSCVAACWHNPNFAWVLINFSAPLGTLSLLLFCLTLVPGMITRLRWLPAITLPVAALITPFRRHLGILMFLVAFVHFFVATSLPSLAVGIFPPRLRPFEAIGMIAWISLLPVWLTSNDFSMKRLGAKWKAVQRLTYFSIWLIIAHVALVGKPLAALVAVVALLEITSWVVARRRQTVKMAPSPVISTRPAPVPDRS